PRDVWPNFLKQLKPFPAQSVFVDRKSRRIAAWPVQAVDETSAERIGDVGKDDRHSRVKTPQRRHAQSTAGENDVRRECDQLRCIFLLKIKVILAPTNIDLDIAPLAPAQLLHMLFECRNPTLTLWIRCSSVHQHADAV